MLILPDYPNLTKSAMLPASLDHQIGVCRCKSLESLKFQKNNSSNIYSKPQKTFRIPLTEIVKKVTFLWRKLIRKLGSSL